MRGVHVLRDALVMMVIFAAVEVLPCTQANCLHVCAISECQSYLILITCSSRKCVGHVVHSGTPK